MILFIGNSIHITSLEEQVLINLMEQIEITIQLEWYTVTVLVEVYYSIIDFFSFIDLLFYNLMIGLVPLDDY